MWEASWRLASRELKIQWQALVVSAIATLFIALITVSVFHPIVSVRFEGGELPFNRFLLDLILIGFTPSFGVLYMSMPYLNFRTIWEDPFSKRMAFYRALPISPNVLARSRILQMLMILTVMLTVFYGTLAVVLPSHYFNYFSLTEYFQFAFLWVGYALCVAGICVYVESGMSGKAVFIFPAIFLIIVVPVMLVVYYGTDKGIVEWSLVAVERFGWWAGGIALLCGAVCCYLWNRALAARLAHRDYM